MALILAVITGREGHTASGEDEGEHEEEREEEETLMRKGL